MLNLKLLNVDIIAIGPLAKCLFISMQMVLSGEALCSRQIVTVLNGEGRVIACDKPRFSMVWSRDHFSLFIA